MNSFAEMLKEEEAAQQAANGHGADAANNTNATNGRKRARVSV